MAEHQKERFWQLLQSHFGTWYKDRATFGNYSYGDVARELCYSNSHFTKLISGSASDAMYERALQNVGRLVQIKQLETEVETAQEAQQQLTIEHQSKAKRRRLLWLALGLSVSAIIAAVLFFNRSQADNISHSPTDSFEAQHPFSQYFERDDKRHYASPYLDVSLVQDYCPCSAYEGKWKLEQEYRMPLPDRKPGLYYLAKAADVRIKCKRGVKSEEKGIVLLGFENIHNEIWLDKSRTPFSPTYFDPLSKQYTEAFYQLDFSTNENFEKVADVYSCFYDEFVIGLDSITRKGEPCGRYAQVHNEQLIKEYEIDLTNILNQVIGNMTSVKCNSATNLFCNPNDLKEGESILNFDCMFSIATENLGLGGGYPYSKGYKLVEQNYSANLLCNCEAETAE